jgi:hypothetical protein
MAISIVIHMLVLPPLLAHLARPSTGLGASPQKRVEIQLAAVERKLPAPVPVPLSSPDPIVRHRRPSKPLPRSVRPVARVVEPRVPRLPDSAEAPKAAPKHRHATPAPSVPAAVAASRPAASPDTVVRTHSSTAAAAHPAHGGSPGVVSTSSHETGASGATGQTTRPQSAAPAATPAPTTARLAPAPAAPSPPPPPPPPRLHSRRDRRV